MDIVSGQAADISGEPPRKRFKASELPLSQVQRSAIDGLVHTFKKKGEFDALRKSVYEQFDNSDARNTLTSSLAKLVEAELEKTPALLGKDRKQAIPLIEGAAERSELYRIAEASIDRFIEDSTQGAEERFREIRRVAVGDEAAAEEHKRGSKTDQDYAAESEARRQGWAKAREEELAIQRQKDEEDRKKRLEERRRREEEEALREKQRQEEEEQARLKQEAEARERAERAERKARQDAQWERERLEKEEKDRKKREKEREKEIEEAALEELIREGKQLAARPGAEGRGIAQKESQLEAIMRSEMRGSVDAPKEDSPGRRPFAAAHPEKKSPSRPTSHSRERSKNDGYDSRQRRSTLDEGRPSQRLESEKLRRSSHVTRDQRPEKPHREASPPPKRDRERNRSRSHSPRPRHEDRRRSYRSPSPATTRRRKSPPPDEDLPDIDRYVPPTSTRSKTAYERRDADLARKQRDRDSGDYDRDRERRDRDRTDREPGRDKTKRDSTTERRDSVRDRGDREKGREDREGGRDRTERERHRDDREPDRDKDGRSRQGNERPAVPIDRYRPGGGADRETRRDRDRDRDTEAGGERRARSRSRHRDRDRDRDRSRSRTSRR